METPSSSDLETSDESDSQSLDDYNPEYEDSPQEAVSIYHIAGFFSKAPNFANFTGFEKIEISLHASMVSV